MRFKILNSLIAGGMLLCGVAHAQPAFTNIDQALKAARSRQEPVFVDFSATWCHDCHAMDAKVLNGPQWDAEQEHFVLVRSDADSVNGKAWMDKLHIPALPTYVVLNPNGSERGRLMGFIPRAKFYPQLDRILSGQDAFGKLKRDAAAGSAGAAAKALRAYDERDQQAEGLRWYAQLPEATRKAVSADPEAAMRLAMVEMTAESHKAWFTVPRLAAAQRAHLEKECRFHARQALKGPIGLDDHFNVAGTLLGCSQELPEARLKAIADSQVPSLTAIYLKSMPSAESGTLRDATYVLASYYKVLGDSAAEHATYQQAIAIGEKALADGHGGFDVKLDPGMADVLAEFLNRFGDQAEYTALTKAQITAYPDNYSYASEYGKALLKQGKAAEALPYLRRAEIESRNTEDHLTISHTLAEALIALNRRPEAVKLFDSAVRTGRAQFPKMTKLDLQFLKKL